MTRDEGQIGGILRRIDKKKAEDGSGSQYLYKKGSTKLFPEKMVSN